MLCVFYSIPLVGLYSNLLSNVYKTLLSLNPSPKLVTVNVHDSSVLTEVKRQGSKEADVVAGDYVGACSLLKDVVAVERCVKRIQNKNTYHQLHLSH